MSKARRTHKEMSEDRVRVYNTLRRAEDYVKMGWLMQRTPDINRRVLRSTLLELIASKQIVTRGKGPAITYAAASNNFKQFCVECGTSETPQWRDNGTRCNACAIAKSRSDKKVVVNTNKRHKWLPAETQQLIAEAQAGLTAEEIAARHDRTPSAIRNRLYRLTRDGSLKWTERTGLQGTPEPIATTIVEPVSIIEEVNTLLAIKQMAQAFVAGEVTLNDLRGVLE